MCRDFATEFNHELINRPSDLVNQFGLLCVFSGDTVSSLCIPPVLFDRALSQAVLSDLGILVATGVHFDVYGVVVYTPVVVTQCGPDRAC